MTTPSDASPVDHGPVVATRKPVEQWATDYDVYDPDYVADPFPVWDQLRRTCPVPHTDRWGGSWMPVRFEDVSAVAHDPEHFSSVESGVAPEAPEAS